MVICVTRKKGVVQSKVIAHKHLKELLFWPENETEKRPIFRLDSALETAVISTFG